MMDHSKHNIDLQEINALPLPLASPFSKDDLHLRQLGKRPLLNRSFGFMSVLGFSCSVLISWEGVLVTSIAGFINGGPAGVIWGFLFNWIGILSTFVTIGEMASMAPTVGGQYHWVAMLAPENSKKFLSYLTAWLTTTAWQAMGAATAYLLATLMQGMIVLTRPTYLPRPWHTVLLMWAIMSFAVVVNSSTGRILANFEGFVLVLHLAGFFCVLTPLVYMAPHMDASAVFVTFINGGGWSSQALSVCVGVPVSAATLLGADGAVHMSEEIQSAATVVPKALVYSIVINGVLAWAMAIAIAFCVGDLEQVIEAGSLLFHPFIEILRQAVKSNAAACALASIIFVMGAVSGVGIYASASRMLWSFSRDRGMPFSSHLVKLNSNALPVTAILATLVITMLLSLIVLGSAVAFNALISLSVAGLCASNLLACTLLLWRRLTGAIQHSEALNTILIDHNARSWGPWRVSEPWGAINNAVACAYMAFIWFWSFWPPATPPTPQTANFSMLVFGTVVIASVMWYVLRAKSYFKGPVKETD